MRLKVMVTGKNKRIVSDICDHLITDKGYSVIKCAPSKEALFNQVPIDLPHLIIICLGDETYKTVSVFDVLKECTRMGGITIMVIANESDQKVFINNTKLERMFFVPRPVSLFALYEKLNEIEKAVEDGINSGSALITEFVNPHANHLPSRKHILVVDDDPEQLLNIKEQLREFYEVTLVPSGEVALRFLSRQSVDLVLLDYLMPVMTGPQVFESIRMMPDLERLPVVFLTGVDEKETVIKTLVDYKPQGYLVKPSKKSELVAKIIDILG